MNREPRKPDSPTSSAGKPAPAPRAEAALILLAAAVVAIACYDHYAKPHGDFHEFRDTGRALLHGELPPTLKRAPVYPLTVALLGSAIDAVARPAEPADRIAAAALNAALLPVNVLLIWLIARRWVGRSARWLALWMLLLPAGLYGTAHLLVEPALLFAVLLCIWMAQRGSGWAYAAAALASLTRYDAAGLIVGVALGDWLRGGDRRRMLVRTGLSVLPLAVWLTLTLITWSTRSSDHYLSQIGEAPQFDVNWSLGVIFQTLLDWRNLSLPVWAADFEPALRTAAIGTLVALSIVGGIVAVRRRDRAIASVAVFVVGYVAVHAVFPYQVFRFGYPPAPVLLLLIAVGAAWLVDQWRRRVPSVVLRAIVLAGGVCVALLLIGVEVDRFRLQWSYDRWSAPPRFLLAALVATALICVTPLLSRGGWRHLARMLPLALALTLIQARAAQPLLGAGDERVNDVVAARWLREHLAPGERVLCPDPGLLRLYVGDADAGRFIGLGEVPGADLAEILAFCRAQHVDYIIWHDQVYQEQGAYYIRKWRLERFAALETPDQVTGLRIDAEWTDRPHLWILRVLPE